MTEDETKLSNEIDDAQEKQARKTFGIRMSQQTQDKFRKILDKFKSDNDPKSQEQEQALLRILDYADNESVRIAHPDMVPALSAIDKTISTLIHQLNGIVSVQDLTIDNLEKEIEQAKLEKNEAIAKSAKDAESARETEKIADEHLRQAFAARDEAEQKAQEMVDAAKKEFNYKMQLALNERDRAIQERDDARALAEEKTVSSQQLAEQLKSVLIWREKYEQLEQEHKSLSALYNELLSQSKEDTMRQEYEIEKAVLKKEQELRIEYEKKLYEMQLRCEMAGGK